MTLDPVTTNPDHYRVVFENDRVRVLEYIDRPGHKTTPHAHPDSVMYTLSTFRRRLYAEDGRRATSRSLQGRRVGCQHSSMPVTTSGTPTLMSSSSSSRRPRLSPSP